MIFLEAFRGRKLSDDNGTPVKLPTLDDLTYFFDHAKSLTPEQKEARRFALLCTIGVSHLAAAFAKLTGDDLLDDLTADKLCTFTLKETDRVILKEVMRRLNEEEVLKRMKKYRKQWNEGPLKKKCDLMQLAAVVNRKADGGIHSLGSLSGIQLDDAADNDLLTKLLKEYNNDGEALLNELKKVRTEWDEGPLKKECDLSQLAAVVNRKADGGIHSLGSLSGIQLDDAADNDLLTKLLKEYNNDGEALLNELKRVRTEWDDSSFKKAAVKKNELQSLACVLIELFPGDFITMESIDTSKIASTEGIMLCDRYREEYGRDKELLDEIRRLISNKYILSRLLGNISNHPLIVYAKAEANKASFAILAQDLLEREGGYNKGDEVGVDSFRSDETRGIFEQLQISYETSEFRAQLIIAVADQQKQQLAAERPDYTVTISVGEDTRLTIVDGVTKGFTQNEHFSVYIKKVDPNTKISVVGAPGTTYNGNITDLFPFIVKSINGRGYSSFGDGMKRIIEAKTTGTITLVVF